MDSGLPSDAGLFQRFKSWASAMRTQRTLGDISHIETSSGSEE